MTRPKVTMPGYHFDYLADQAKEMGAITISIFGYGEPLVDDDIVRKVQYCTDKGLSTFITTNASLLSMQLSFDLLKAGLKHIRFSVHGVGRNYEKVHRGLRFDSVLRNISNFKAIVDKRYPFVRTSVSVIPRHGETVEYLKDYWKGFDLEVWRPHNWCEGRKYRTVTKKRKKTCGRVHSGPVQIQADGDVIPCCFLTNAEIVLGNTYKCTIEEILKGWKYEDLRKKHEAGDMRGLPCDLCDQLNIGDNPLLFSTVDPSCEVGKTSSTKFKLKEK